MIARLLLLHRQADKQVRHDSKTAIVTQTSR